MTAATLVTGVGMRVRKRVRSARSARAVPLPAHAVLLATTVGVLNVVGVVMVLSASSVLVLTREGSPWPFFLRHLMYVGLGVAAFVLSSRFDYHRWRSVVRPLLVVSVGLLVAVLLPGVGVFVSGSRRWIGYGAIRFQPSEIAKLALLLYAADLVSRRADEADDPRRVLYPILAVVAGLGLLVMKEPDLGSTLVLGVIAGAVLWVSGVRLGHLFVTGVFGAGLVTMLSIAEPYRRARLLSFLHPFEHASGAGYQVAQSLIAIGSGGWTGVGLGAGRAKWNFLPNAHTDFIFAVIGEELGVLGCALVLGLFVMFAVVGIRAAARAPDGFGTVLAVGVTAWIVGQALINVGAVVGLLPVSGIPLPFVSYGGTALVSSMLAAGVLANVARQAR